MESKGMISECNFKDLLIELGFAKDGNSYKKSFSQYGCELEANFKDKKLIYPSQILGRERNDGFDKKENFVVFECVNRLLEKGYRPEHIELEKEWHLGHDPKSGRGDICVYGIDGKCLLIIECKTYGTEYLKAFKNTMTDGAQLFSYWQQEMSTKWLALYASDLVDGKVVYNCPVIDCSDDANIIKLAEKDHSIHLYSSAYTAIDKFNVWKNTYNNKTYPNLIFDPDNSAYNVGVKLLKKANLRDFKPTDKIVNKFEEILRHNNVSDKENAFNRLVALFICKLVDEIGKTDSEVVDFQYKQGTDTYETLQDRLQKLHKQGMDDFMKESIYYVESDYAEKLFAQYGGSQRKQAIEDLNNTIRILKFYTNNDFAFKDVHNEELFYQNGKILVEVVELFQEYRVVYSNKHQFLGDLFEQLLNKGFKQNEGQFFTPTPITRFIWDSLPIEKSIMNNGRFCFPKIIDFACGAGHFLTEAVEAVNEFYKSKGNESAIQTNSWVDNCIFGIEKDYRLARVSKVCMFMNGAGGSNIIFGDGLENYSDKKITPRSFDILVANPPYSVSGFKRHLALKHNQFEIMDSITNDGSEIEALFVERMGQLVKPNGLAAVILPETLLTVDNSSYVAAREQMIKHFLIRSIVCLGSNTFGATGTNTVIVFLQKMDEPPVRYKVVEDSANCILSGAELAWEDKTIFDLYTQTINVSQSIYKKVCDCSISMAEIAANEYLDGYLKYNEKNIKKIKDSKMYKKAMSADQDKMILDFLLKEIRKTEKEKLIYFALVYKQNCMVINSPNKNSQQKHFLGYSWSNRKGSEGIVIHKPGGMLYDDADRYSENTLAYAVRKTFDDKSVDVEGMNSYYNHKPLIEMIDFASPEFNKAIKTKVSINIKIKSKYSKKPIESITPTIESGSRPKGGVSMITSGVLSLGGEHIDNENGCLNLSEPKYVPIDFYNEATDGKIQKFDILLCKDGAKTGKIAIVKDELEGKDAMVNEHVFILRSGDELIQKYLFAFLFSRIGQNLIRYNTTGTIGGLNSTKLKAIKIPLPPVKQIKDFMTKFDEITNKFNSTRMSIDEYQNQIENELVSRGIAELEKEE